ncbi:MAG TPA: FkbM family methyltransferase [Candidatus Paceibacterota bacterium]
MSTKKEHAKHLLGATSRIVPAGAWEKLEYTGAYFAGKGSGSNSVKEEVAASFRYMTGDKLILFDLGANKGDWTLEALRVGGVRVKKIYQFEPSAHNIQILKKEFGGDDRVELLPYAASDKSGAAELFSDVPGSGIASLYKRRLDHFNIEFKAGAPIEMKTVDDVIEKNVIEKVDFMKMDIEGHELSALHGASSALKNGTIRALSFEFGGANIDSRTYFQDFWYLLVPLGYRLFRILPAGSVLPVKNYTEMLENFRTTNYIAVYKTI